MLLACSFTPVRSLSHGFPATATPENSYVAVTGTTDLQVTSDPACSAAFADAHLGYFERARTEHAPVSGVICVKNIGDRATSWSMFASATTRQGDVPLTTRWVTSPTGDPGCPDGQAGTGSKEERTSSGDDGWRQAVLLSDPTGGQSGQRPLGGPDGSNPELPPGAWQKVCLSVDVPEGTANLRMLIGVAAY